jgi:ethanolamine utilization protein EutN
MKIGQVIGNIWCTRKEESLTGLKLMRVRLCEQQMEDPDGNIIVAVDTIGAGIGEMVLLVQGSSARKHEHLRDAPIDTLIVGIIDPDNDTTAD